MSQARVETDSALMLDLLQLALTGTLINDASFTSAIGDRRTSGAITNVTAASPIVVTSAGHGLSNGQEVILTQVIGVPEAKGVFTVANVTADTFELSGSDGSGAFVLDGTPMWYLAVDGATALTLEYQTGSRGRYAVIIPGDVPIANKGKYIAIIDAVGFRMHIEHEFTGGVWK